MKSKYRPTNSTLQLVNYRPQVEAKAIEKSLDILNLNSLVTSNVSGYYKELMG